MTALAPWSAVPVEERRAAYASGIQERQVRLSLLREEVRTLEEEIEYFKALAFEDETEVRDDFVLVDPSDYEHLVIGSTVRVLILRLVRVGEPSWFGEGEVTNYGGWRRGAIINDSHVTLFDGSKPTVATIEGVELKVWRKVPV